MTGLGGDAAPPRLILANLDFEEELRAAFGPRGPLRSLTPPARQAATAAGSLLRVFCQPGDRLWLPAPLDAGRLPELPGLPVPVLEHGPAEVLAPARALLAWGHGTRAEALRQRWGRESKSSSGQGEEGVGLCGESSEAPGEPLHEALWRVPPPTLVVVGRVAHRSFALELARDLGRALPGSRLVADLGELEAHLASGDRRSGVRVSSGRWVVKAPYSAAGRERHLGASPEELRRPEIRRRLEGLFERHGALLFEPWVERLADFGCAGLLGRTSLLPAGGHGLEVDRRGAFRAIVLPAAPAGEVHREYDLERDAEALGLRPVEAELLQASFEATAARLRSAGYTGPFGLDSYRWRRPDGTAAFQPLGELNPRLTFGLVARCLVERLAGPLASRGRPLRLSLVGPAPRGALVLLEPGDDGSFGAWLAA